MSKPYIIANWKMNLDMHGIKRFFEHFDMDDHVLNQTNIVICPSFPFLDQVRSLIGARQISVAGQNLSWEEKGPYTGEVSGRQLADVGCQYVIIGHSERRSLFHETDAMVNQKTAIAVRCGLRPIICLGENSQEKEAATTKKVIEEKLQASLSGLRSHEMKKVIIAYEPIWAISTSPENPDGVSDSPESAQVIHKFIKHVIAGLFDEHIAEAVPVIYGGSVSPDNISGFAAMDDIDGVLVGGASKEADSFKKIISAFTK